jgi:hypothetical protein
MRSLNLILYHSTILGILGNTPVCLAKSPNHSFQVSPRAGAVFEDCPLHKRPCEETQAYDHGILAETDKKPTKMPRSTIGH